MPKDDPYHDIKVVHLANKIDQRGRASALCSKKPRAINMKVATFVLYQPEAVTCKKCRAAIQAASEVKG